MKKTIYVFMSAAICLSMVLGYGQLALAEESASSGDQEENIKLKIYNLDTLELEKAFDIFDQEFEGNIAVSAFDFEADGWEDMLVTLSNYKNPHFALYNKDGYKMKETKPYPEGFTGSISATVGDLNGDGKMEVVSVPGKGGGPQVRVFDSFMNPVFTPGFFAHEPEYRNGIEVGTGDVNGDQKDEILVAISDGIRPAIKVYNAYGDLLNQFYLNEEENEAWDYQVKVGAMDLGDDGIEEIIVANGPGKAPLVQIYRLDGSKVNEFYAYHPGFGGGFDFDIHDDKKWIIAGAGFSGTSHVRFLDSYGNPQKTNDFFAYDKSFRKGIDIAVSEKDKQLITVPAKLKTDGSVSYYQYIYVSIAQQKMYAYKAGELDAEFWISSGTWKYPTPTGKYKINYKKPSGRMSWTYGPDHPDNYDLANVPHIMSFNGAYTIHGAYWHHNFGYRMSHGCVNLSLPNAKWMYDWTPLGTPVIIE